MSLEATSKHLTALLHDEEVKVIALSGRWGTGKSHMWHKVQKTATMEKVQKAAVVSLFGLSTIEQVKLKLIQSAAVKGDQGWLEKARDAVIPGLAMLEKVHKGFGLVNDVGLLVAPTVLSGKLIVLDDIERKHEKLHLDEILGFIDEFIQRNDARFLLILNSDRLKNREIWDTLREKVVDHELKLNTSCEEAFKVAALGVPTMWSADILKAVQHCEITNIRIIRKIIQAVNKVIGTRDSLRAPTLNKVVPSTVLLAAINYRGIENGPDLSYVLAFGAMEMWADVYKQQANKDKKEPETEEDRQRGRWRSLMSRLGIHSCDGFEVKVCDYLQTGLVGDSPVASLIDGFEAKSEAMEARAAVQVFGERCFWDHRSSAADLLRDAQPLLAKVSLLDAYTATWLHDYLKELPGGDVMADEVIKRWCAAYAAAPEPGVLDALRRRQAHPDIMALLMTEESKNSDDVSVIGALRFITANSGWNTSEELVMKGATTEMFDSIIRNASTSDLQLVMSKMLDIAANDANYEAHFGDAGKNFVSACRQITSGAQAGDRLASLIWKRFEESNMATLLHPSHEEPAS